MGHMATPEFEALYRNTPDPWGYETSTYEQSKYRATLEACGSGPFAQALELGGSIGVFTALLAPRCRQLISIDSAPTAVRSARIRLEGFPQVETVLGSIPDEIPARTYDLVVASEILYYLEPNVLEATLAFLSQHMPAPARLVAVHWRPSGPERPFTAEQVHARLRELEWLAPVRSGDTSEYLLEVLERR
jgi:trans-aconitate methyltransferase